MFCVHPNHNKKVRATTIVEKDFKNRKLKTVERKWFDVNIDKGNEKKEVYIIRVIVCRVLKNSIKSFDYCFKL